MGKKTGFRISKRLMLVLAVVLVFLGSTGGAYYAGVKKGEKLQVSKSAGGNQSGGMTADSEEAKEELDTQQRRIFDEYKKKIEENKLTGDERVALLVNASITGAAVKAPEAKDYARMALDEMSAEMKRSAGSRDLISQLEKIASGEYN